MKELLDAIKIRLGSPVFGYFALSLIAFNWEAIFYLFAQDGDAAIRIRYFEDHSSKYSLIVYPFIFSLIFSIFYPWLHFLIAWLTAKPIELKEVLQVTADNKLFIRKKQLEEDRANFLASTELELIARAKRDQELETLENDEIKDKLKLEIEQLRHERDSLRDDQTSNINSIHTKHKELMDIASTYRKQASEPNINVMERGTFNSRARDLEEKAHELLMESEIVAGKNS